jgi:hypothetical protein
MDAVLGQNVCVPNIAAIVPYLVFCSLHAYYAAFNDAGSMGSARIRFPVAAKMALQSAGAMGGTPGSPTPPGGALLSKMWT